MHDFLRRHRRIVAASALAIGGLGVALGVATPAMAGTPGPYPAVVAGEPGPYPAVVAQDPGPFPALVKPCPDDDPPLTDCGAN